MRTGTHEKVVVRPGNIQLVKEDIRHLRVIMLPGMDEDLLVLLPELPGERGALDKLRTCPDNGDDLHGYSVRIGCPFLSPRPIPLYTKPALMNVSGSITFLPSTITVLP